MRFNQQRAPFVQAIRDKSKSVIDERAQVSAALSTERDKIAALKARQHADEPKCEELRRDNAALTAKMMDIKEVQEQTAGECEVLRKDKSDLLSRKVPTALNPFGFQQLSLPYRKA